MKKKALKLIFCCCIGLILILGSISSVVGKNIIKENIFLSQKIISDKVSCQKGWPQKTNGSILSSPALADLDNDGRSEIVIGSDDGYLYIFQYDGTLFPGWPIYLGGRIISSPCIADINNDGSLDIITGSFYGKVYAFNYNGSIIKGWPQNITKQLEDFPCSSPSIADLDNDGHMEVVIGSHNGYLYAWHYNGSLVEGWPIYLGGLILATPAIADLNNDRFKEIVIGTNNGNFYVFNQDGTNFTGWPKNLGHSIWTSSAATADLNNDGIIEIIIGTQSGLTPAEIFVFYSNGTQVSGWPHNLSLDTNSNPAVGDIDNDGDLEIVIATMAGWNNVYAWHANGTLVNGWPKQTNTSISSHPSIGDIDGDNSPEIIVGCLDGKMYAWHNNGGPVEGWPKQTGGPINYMGVALGDLNSDGHVEVVAGSEDGYVYVWDLPGKFNEKTMEWPTFHHDNFRSGYYPLKNFSITIIKPEQGWLYMFNKKLLPTIFSRTIIIGPIDVQIKITQGIDKVGFFLNNEIQYFSYSPPWIWRWENRSLSWYNLKVIAYDNNQKCAFDEMQVLKIF